MIKADGNLIEPAVVIKRNKHNPSGKGLIITDEKASDVDFLDWFIKYQLGKASFE